jgi:type IV pilus assembly protein PilC
MSQFTYTAVNKEGKTVSSTTEAKNKEAVSALLTRQGYRPLVIKEQRGISAKGLGKIFGNGKVKHKDMVIFTRQLSTMINAGVPLVRSLATLLQQTENKALKTVLVAISKDVESGLSLGDSLAKHPTTFSPIYINMVRAGEAGGILDDILNKLAIQQEKDARIRAKVKSASTYPIILLTITIGAFFALTIFVIPKIGKMIQDLAGEDTKLPPQTQIMLAISDFMKNRWYILIAVAVITIFIYKRYTATEKGKFQKDYILLKIPVIKVVITKVAIARFSRIFASLMAAGVSVLETLEVTGNAIGNKVIERELTIAAKAVKNGQQLSQPLSESKYFPPIVSQMLAIGEETGQSETILLKVADFYEEEVDAVVDGMSSIIEPVMIAVMGGMVGLIAASVIGPISSLAQNIKS